MIDLLTKRILSICCALVVGIAACYPCTSAIISGKVTPSGRPILWKHRDTGSPDGKIEFIPAKDGDMAYVALFNANDPKCEQAWIGMNAAGFAVMNTASYNLKDDKVPEKQMDREGFVMTIALRTCRTVDDFQRLLETLPRPMGVEANFGAIDASGNGAYFETNNHSFTRFDLADAEEGFIVRTNYSHSGRKDEGYGYIREANALHLIAPAAAEKAVTPEFLTETVSRSFYHNIFGRDLAECPDSKWLIDQDFIPRYTSTATIAIEGVAPDSKALAPASEYIMWTGLGYPPCAEIVPVICRPGGVDDDLRGLQANGHSAMSDKVKARRDECFSIRRGSGNKYIDITRLYNPDATGYVQILTPQNREVYRTINRKRNR